MKVQLINNISNDLQKLLKYFSGTAIFTPFFVPFAPVLLIILALYLNERALIIISHICIISYLIYFKTPKTFQSIRIIVTIFSQIVHGHCNINSCVATASF